MKDNLRKAFSNFAGIINPPLPVRTLNPEVSASGLTPAEVMLLTGAKTKDTGLIAEAVRQGADPNLRGGEALIRAAAQYDPGTAKALVLAGADVALAAKTATLRMTRPNARGHLETYGLTDLYSIAAHWLTTNRGDLLQHYIDQKLPALEAENKALRQSLDDGAPRMLDKKVIAKPGSGIGG